MLVRLALSSAVFLLAACGEKGPASADGAEAPQANAAAPGGGAPVAIKPGRWKVNSTSPGMAPQVDYLCVTPEQAASGSFMRGEAPEGCKTERDVVKGGRIDFAARCESEGRVMSSSMSGTYTSTTYTADLTLDMGGEVTRAQSQGVYEAETCQPGDQKLSM